MIILVLAAFALLWPLMAAQHFWEVACEIR